MGIGNNAVLWARLALGVSLAVTGFSGALAQDVIKIGQIEGLTGANAYWGFMPSQGARMAVSEINAAGGFEVGGKNYKLELVQMDTRGEPREATVQFRKLLEDNVHFIFGPFLSNVFNAIEPIATQNAGKFLMLAGTTAAHARLAQPNSEFLIRTYNWDAGPTGFGTLMVKHLRSLGVKKVAILYPNDALGKTVLDLYGKLFKDQGIESVAETFEPGTKDFSAPLAKLAAAKPDFLMPGYSDAVLYDIVRQATESGTATKFFIVRGSIGPAIRNKDAIDDYIAYVPKYFEGAEKVDPAVGKFVEDYRRFYKTEFPYDQAPLCASSCYDHVYMLVQAMKTAGTVNDVAKIRTALLTQTYRGLWNYKYDDTGEAVFSFNIVHVKKGGDIALMAVDPTR